MFKKILFPFFNNKRHNFLKKKGWFRGIIVFYITALVLATPYLQFKLINSAFDHCVNNRTDYETQINCNEAIMDGSYIYRWDLKTFFGVLAFVLIMHYLIQLIFFKITIDFIVLGEKKE